MVPLTLTSVRLGRSTSIPRMILGSFSGIFAMGSYCRMSVPLDTRKSNIRPDLLTSILSIFLPVSIHPRFFESGTYLASRRLRRPRRRSFSRMYVCLIARYGFGRIRREEHSCCSSDDSSSSDWALDRLSGVATYQLYSFAVGSGKLTRFSTRLARKPRGGLATVTML